MRGKLPIIITGVVVGVLGIILMQAGNPANMGFCIACFLRDIAGGLGLHQAGKVQFIRPEILGIVIGAFTLAIAKKEFKVLGGASALTRFVLAIFAMVGFLVFLGCPLRMVLRLAAGDLNALAGLAGLAVGIAAAVFFISRGFTLGRARPLDKANGYVFPFLIIGLLVLFLAVPAMFFYSKEGPGAQHATILVSLVAGLIVGGLAQHSRLCFVGGLRDFFMFRDTYLLTGMITIFITTLIGVLIIGEFHLGFTGQPVSHTDGLFNFLGMALAGLASTLLGGCPLRQLVSGAEGNTDSAVTVMGLIVGAAIAHNFKLAAGPEGVPVPGQYAVFIGLAVVIAIATAFSVVRITVQGRVTREQTAR